MPENKDLRATRQHIILATRAVQLKRNLLAVAGGGPYIDARLARYTCESESSWTGTKEIPARKERAFMVNYAGRIAQKINQYVFAQETVREGIDPEFAQDASRTGRSISQLMADLSADLTAGQWAWIQVDRGSPGIDPQTGQLATRSLAARAAAGDRIFWTVWDSTEIVDWCFDAAGGLKWLLTQEARYTNDDPMVPAVVAPLRTLWRNDGTGDRIYIDPKNPENVVRVESFATGIPAVPFLPIGVPSASAYWFDDVERIQASLLNLESAHNENLIQTVFPQLIIPTSLIAEIQRLSERTFEQALELVRGLAYPLLEPTDDKGLTRYLTPTASDLKAIPDEILRRRRELFETAGLALNDSDTKQVSSAAAKAWDNLDPAATLRARAQVLQEAETKAVALARELDTTFPEYTPVYPKEFAAVGDFAEDLKAILETENAIALPDSARKELARTVVDMIDAKFGIDPETKKQILADIDADEGALDLQALARARAVAGNAPPAA